MNEYDSNRIYDLARKINYEKTDNFLESDCYVLNTCHIREKATDKVYHDVGRVKKYFRNKKKPIVIITGCVAQAEGEIILNKENYVDAVVGPQSYHKFNETLLRIEKKKEKINSTEFEVVDKFDKLNFVKNSDNNVSAFLTIQEGCDKFCKFCVVPYTRGPEFSRSFDDIIKETNQLADNGSKEIILLGQNVNAYSYNGKRLSNLISEISKNNKVQRIRYTTSHPIDFSSDLIQEHKKNKKLMPLIHLPVQSGSNEILRKMNRKHSIEEYIDLVDELKKNNSLIKFSSDFIIGYPGETEKDFEETLNLLDKIKYINTYSFLYSSRPGTPSANLKQVDNQILRERLKIFQKKAEAIKLTYRRNLFKKSTLVLFENQLKGRAEFFGRDEYFNSVIVKSNENLKGKILNVQINDGNHNTLFGEVIYKKSKNSFAA